MLELNQKSVAIIAAGVVGVAALVGTAYYFGQKQTAAPQTQALKIPAPAQLQGDAFGANRPGAAAQGGPQQQGKVQVDPNAKFTHFRVGNRNVKSMLLEGKVLWVGTSGGVIRYDTTTDDYRLYDSRNGLLSNGIFYVSKLGDRVLVGTYGGGMSLYDAANDKWETYNIAEGLGDAFVYGTLQTSTGDVWVATWSGANRIRGGALKDRSKWDLFTVENTKNGLPNDWVYGLAEGKNGEIWMATEGGLARYKDGKWDNWNHSKGLGAPFELVKDDIKFNTDPAQVSNHHAKQKEEMGLQGVSVSYNPNYIIALQVDAEGVVWAGTWGGGLASFDGKTWRNYTVKDGLPGNHVFMLYKDPAGKMWVGTNNGLARKDGDKFTVMTTEQGLFSNNVFSMVSGTAGDLWVGSYGGVAHIAASK